MQAYPCVSVGLGMANNPQIDSLHKQLIQTMTQRGVLSNQRVKAAFESIPRHLFLPEVPLEQAYSDSAIGIKKDRGIVISSSSQPTMMAIMLTQLKLEPGHNVLEIGTATGYNAAIMQHIVGDRGHVTSVEIEKDLARSAITHLQNANMSHVNVVHADGVYGYPPRASFDRIVSTVGVWDIPPNWLHQLKPDGRLVVPIWLDGIQVSTAFTPTQAGTYVSYENRPCEFVYLRGEAAGPRMMKQVGSTSLYIVADEVDDIDTAALHLLLSDDHAREYLGQVLSQADYWYGFQLYLMLNEAEDTIFAVYSVAGTQQAYGLEGSGVAIFAAGSAAFLPYGERGAVEIYGGADAYLFAQDKFDEWNSLARPGVPQLRVRLIPKGTAAAAPTIERGKLYTRRFHYVHVWLEV